MNNIDILEELIRDYKDEKEFVGEDIIKSIETLIAENKELKEKNKELEEELEKEKEKNKKAKEFIKENSHEFNCKRDDLIELEFDDNTNATDLIDILEGNY